MSDYSVFADYTDPDYAPLIKEYLFYELRHYIDFKYVWQGPNHPKDDDIDRERSYLQTNTREQLFSNEVGSWQFRPGPTCKISNLFLAGDHCKTFIDVVTIEGAVVSGLMAAEASRQRTGVGEPIEIIEPDAFPQTAMAALKLMGAPYAYAAKAWTVMADGFASRCKDMFPNG